MLFRKHAATDRPLVQWEIIYGSLRVTGKSLTAKSTKYTKKEKGLSFRHFPFVPFGVKMIFPSKAVFYMSHG